MRLDTEFVRPLVFKTSAFEQAKIFYALHANDETEKLDFESDIVEYLKIGFVYSSPTSFALAKVINVAPEDSGLVEMAWFIRCAVGSLWELLSKLPVLLPTIVWCRDNDGNLKKYKTEALFRIAKALNKGTM